MMLFGVYMRILMRNDLHGLYICVFGDQILYVKTVYTVFGDYILYVKTNYTLRILWP